jgi:uncharacterized membrane protein (DUF2068 family)
VAHQKSFLLSWIVALKFVKSALLAALGIVLLAYVREDPVNLLMQIAMNLHLPVTSRLFDRAYVFATGLTMRREVALAVTALVYSVVFGVEGTGLSMRRSWARWLTIGITASLLPFEIYEIAQRPGSPLRIATFVVNVAIVVYLYKRKEAFEPPGAPALRQVSRAAQ